MNWYNSNNNINNADNEEKQYIDRKPLVRTGPEPLPEVSNKMKLTIKILTIVFDIFAITTAVLLLYQFSLTKAICFDFGNPLIAFSNTILPVIVILIVWKSIHGFESHSILTVLLFTLLMFCMSVLMAVAFFVPISFGYLVPIIIILFLTLLLLFDARFSRTKNILIILLVIAVFYSSIMTATKVSMGYYMFDKDAITAYQQENQNGGHRIIL